MGPTTKVVWMPTGRNRFHEIVSITDRREAGAMCANLEDGSYLILEDEPAASFAIVTRME